MLIICLVLIQLLVTTEIHAGIKVNKKEIVARKGEEIELICTADSEALGCSFKVRNSESVNTVNLGEFK